MTLGAKDERLRLARLRPTTVATVRVPWYGWFDKTLSEQLPPNVKIRKFVDISRSVTGSCASSRQIFTFVKFC